MRTIRGSLPLDDPSAAMSTGRARIAYIILAVVSIGLSIFAILSSSQQISVYRQQTCGVLKLRLLETVPKPALGSSRNTILRYERQQAYIKMYKSFNCNKENQDG